MNVYLEQLANSWQYIVNFLLITLYYISPKIQTAWNFFNDYALWRTALLILILYLVALSLSRDLPKILLNSMGKLRLSIGQELLPPVSSFIFRIIFLSGLMAIVSSFSVSAEQKDIIIAIIKSLMIASFFFFADKVARILLSFFSQEKEDKKVLSEGERADEYRLIQPATLPIFEYTTLIFLLMLGIYSVFKVWGIEMTALLASAGIMGLAISMAAKDTLSDVIAGILILTDAPFKLGDIIEVKGEVGKIVQIGIRSTRIRTPQNIEIIIPNGKMGASEVINKTAIPVESMGITLNIQAAYGVDPKKIRDILTQVAKDNENVLQEEDITVSLDDFNQAHTNFTLSCRIKEGSLKKSTLSAMREQAYLAFLSQNIEVALPSKEHITITDFPYIFNSGQARELKRYSSF
ncbi:MAG: mechanosensitive ion channel family protein [bacterium]